MTGACELDRSWRFGWPFVAPLLNLIDPLLSESIHTSDDLFRLRNCFDDAVKTLPYRYRRADAPEMTLHRDIYWLGRQWAVTGHGIQAVNKKLNMRFDVEASGIWQDGIDEPMRQLDWFDAEDFAEALRVARRLSQETPAKFQPLAGGEK
jgi:hypothetical protein